MKMVKIILMVVLMGVVLTGCFSEYTGDETEVNNSTESFINLKREYNPDKVKLLWATAEQERPNGSYGDTYIYGEIEVENMAYEKVVAVFYGTGAYGQISGYWSNAYASYSRAGEGNKEIWEFRQLVSESIYGTDVQFAVRYEVDGQEYWDNNNWQDYKIGAGPYSVFPLSVQNY